MVRINKKKFLNILCSKGFKTENHKGHIILYFDYGGSKGKFKASVQRGGHGKTIEDYHVLKIAKQLNLTKEELIKFYDCTLYKEDYIPLTIKNSESIDPLDLLQ